MSSANRNTAYTFFGATGGCTNYALVLALKAGKQCTALARTPGKLTSMLAANGVSQEAMDTCLRIQQGDAKDITAVKATLSAAPPDMIISGIGMDAFAKNADTTICQEAARTLLAALGELQLSQKPHVVIVSTTGISKGARDVPLLFVPMYDWLLRVPHEDKKVMEQLYTDAAAMESPVISATTFIRPALLMDRDEPKGLERIEVGSEEKPAVGYTIPRKDVGLWIFEKLIAGDPTKWQGANPTLVGH